MLTFYSGLYAEEIELGTIDVVETVETPMLKEKLTQTSATLAKKSKGESLGDYLEDEQFVDSASYGPAVGRPVVRGMDGYRVGVTHGNVVLNDLSSMSQDHAVAVMPRASEKIELLKGPSSLLYGNYSGGVVRVLGEEHTKTLLKRGYSLETVSNMGSNGVGNIIGTTLRVSDYNLSLSANTYYHKADNYKDGLGDEVKDSNLLSEQSHIVLGYQLNEDNLIKIYADKLYKNYGIPNSTNKSTTIKMNQEQYGAVWYAKNIFGVINQMQTEIQTSDYLHSELEGDRDDGLFGQNQTTISTMFDFDSGDWNVITNFEYHTSSLKVCHEHGKCSEFYDATRTSIVDGVELQKNIDNLGLPFSHGHPMPNISESILKLGLSMSKFINDDNALTFTLRGESRKLDPDSKNIQEVWLVTPQIDPNYYDSINDHAFSISAGVSSFVNDIFSFQTSLSYIERLPSSTELFWNGFHHATDSYIFGDRYLDSEKSLNFDIDTMFNFNSFTTQVSAFYYHFYNYIYQSPLADNSGLLLVDPFHSSNVWAMRGTGAKVFGTALKESYKKEIAEHKLDVSLTFEAIRGVLLDGGNLPRIPTYSLKFAIEDSYKDFTANISYKYVDKSRFEAENETETPAYSWLSASVSYSVKNSYFDGSIYLKGENLTNEIAYNHLSFLKTTAPLSGRQISLGLELKF